MAQKNKAGKQPHHLSSKEAPDLTRETFLIGPECREFVVSRDRVPHLATHGFMWVGHGTLLPPYRMVRPRTYYSHIIATLEGKGRVWIDGKFQDWRPNQVLLSPQGTLHAFEACSSEPWRTAWVFYDDRKGDAKVGGQRTRLVEADCTAFARVLELLTGEVAGEGDPSNIQALVTLLHSHAQRLAGDTRSDERLVRLWKLVEGDLTHVWTIEALAKAAHLSAEHLRRLCHRFHRKSPMAHVRDLRMHYASMLLTASSCTVEEIALQSGFASLYSFSAAFKRWSGVSPVRFRSRGGARS